MTPQQLPFAEPIIAIANEHANEFRASFLEWLPDNLHVWRAFEREANRVWTRGRRHYSARTIIEVLRHETALSDSSAEFKIGNNATPDLSRLYRVAHPQRAGLFDVREGGRERVQ